MEEEEDQVPEEDALSEMSVDSDDSVDWCGF